MDCLTSKIIAVFMKTAVIAQVAQQIGHLAKTRDCGDYDNDAMSGFDSYEDNDF